MRRRLTSIAALALVTGCGGLGVPDFPTVDNGISPASAMVREGETVQFVFVDHGITVTDAVWILHWGSIGSSGKYTAPNASGSYEVSAAFGHKSGTAIVLVG
jgi:hypothetical protein